MLHLNQFLSRFNQATIKRSQSYVERIDLETLDIFNQGDQVQIYAQIQGEEDYDTTINYSNTLQRILDTDCSCSVGIDCKHAAALARFFYHKELEQQQQTTAKNPSADQHSRKALSWLNEFKNHIQQQDVTHANGQIIYLLNDHHMPNHFATAYKVRRNKAGEIRDHQRYDNYENILSKRIKLLEHERHLFLQLYLHAQLQEQHPLQPALNFTDIPLDQFKNFIQSGNVYWHDILSPALSWSDEHYQIYFSWKNHHQHDRERLVPYFTAGADLRLSEQAAEKVVILPTTPPVYLDYGQHCVGYLDCNLNKTILMDLLDMPEIPSHLLEQFDQLKSQHLSLEQLPASRHIAALDECHGAPIPVLRFGALPQLNLLATQHHIGIAEIEFEYPSGRIPSGGTESHFMGSQHDRQVKQHRDLRQEQKIIEQLQQEVPGLTWLNQWLNQNEINTPHNEAPANAITAADQTWFHKLVPNNQIEALGWKVEHTPQSQFNVIASQHLDIQLKPSAKNYDWFELNASISDAEGHTYNLFDLVAELLMDSPHFLEQYHLDQLDDDGFIHLRTQSDRPQLLIPVKELKPILIHLKEIFQQPGHNQLDRYDASQVLELQHHLGMQWQSNQALQSFAEKLKQGYQQHLPTPQGFQGELRTYQQQGLAWLEFLIETEHGGILADDMGLGKTAQTLAHILMQKQAGRLNGTPALIVAPTSLMHNWYKEAAKFTPDLKVMILQGPERHELFKQIPQVDIVLTTYPLLSRDHDELLKHQYHLCILDEAQNIKNPRAKAAQVLRQLQAKHRLCLTGTPMENHLGELWSLFYFLMPGFLYSQDTFNKNYRFPIEKNGDQHKKNKLVNRIQPFMLRRLKTDVAKELPPKTTIEVHIDMHEQQAKLYEAVRASMQSNIQKVIANKGIKRSQMQILDALLKLRQVCCHPSLLKLDSVQSQAVESAKLDHLVDMVQSMREEGRRILIFSQFTSMLQLIEARLNALDIDHVKLTGQTKKRDQVIQAFQTGEVPVFLISLKAGGVGLNLTAADTVIHYDPWWNPAAEEQASDRAWRIGQDKPVFVYKLISNESIEEKILSMQKAKADLAQSILSVDHEQDVKLSEDDVMQLFEKF